MTRKKFNELIKLMLGSDQKLAQRAAWAFHFASEQEPQLLIPHLDALIKKLGTADAHPAVYRNILRELQDYPVPEKHHAFLFDNCLQKITDTSKPLAIRAFAMSTAANISKSYPEFKNEMLLLLNGLLDYPQAPAILSRAKKVLKQLKS